VPGEAKLTITRGCVAASDGGVVEHGLGARPSVVYVVFTRRVRNEVVTVESVDRYRFVLAMKRADGSPAGPRMVSWSAWP